MCALNYKLRVHKISTKNIQYNMYICQILTLMSNTNTYIKEIILKCTDMFSNNETEMFHRHVFLIQLLNT